MKTTLLVGGILLVGALLGYVIFLTMGGKEGNIFDTSGTSSFQNTIIHTRPSSNQGGGTFQTQGFTSKPSVINR